MFWTAGSRSASSSAPPSRRAARSSPGSSRPGREGEVFGLYATTGRAVSFLAPTAFALFVTFGGAPYFGILGIVLVLVGLCC